MKLQMLMVILLGTILVVSTEIPKSSYTRTVLKVARSLPGETEELKVRTAEGGIATLIVKRREKSFPNLRQANTHNSNQATRVEKVDWTPLDVDGEVLNIVKSTTEDSVDETAKSTEERGNYGLLFARNVDDNERKKSIGEKITFLPHQNKRTNIGANLWKNRGGKNVPAEVTVRSELNVNSLTKRMPMSMDADSTPVIYGKRVPDEPIDKIQTWRNARVINNKLIESTSELPGDSNYQKQRFERFFQDVNRSTSQSALTPELWLRRYGRNLDEDQEMNNSGYFEFDPKSHRNRALNAEVYETRNENYRSNIQKRMLHREGAQIYPNSLIYTPESVKIAPLAPQFGVRAPVLQYAHPELGVQPAKILERKRMENISDNQNSNSFNEQRHRKKYVLNDKTIIDSYNYKNYYPNQHFYGLKQHVEPPFWVKISENLKNQLSTGVERVSQLTKPVIDPLVEATQKISQNLGLSRSDVAQEKIATVATGSSILFPALGLVASGAALGIGAVAVGRYLDVDMLKRSNEFDNNNNNNNLRNSRTRRLENVESFVENQRQRKQMGSEDVIEIRVPTSHASSNSEKRVEHAIQNLENHQKNQMPHINGHGPNTPATE